MKRPGMNSEFFWSKTASGMGGVQSTVPRFLFACFSAPFSAASLSQLRGAAGTRVLQKKIGGQLPRLHAVFTEGSVLACTRRLPGRQPRRPRPRWARSKKGTKVAQARGGQRSEAVSEGERSCSAQPAGPSVDISTSKGRLGLWHAEGGGEKRRPLTPSGLRPLHRSQPGGSGHWQEARGRLLPCGAGPQEGQRVGPGCAENGPPQRR